MITTYYENLQYCDKLVLLGYCFCIICCLLFSTNYHIFMCYSHDVYKTCILLDYQGVIINIFASSSILIYNIFYNHLLVLLIYIFILLLVSLTISIMIHDPKWDLSDRSKFRVFILTLNTLCLLIPICHGCFITPILELIVISTIMVFGINGLGGMVYAYKFPEIFISNKVIDYIGNSHNIMHCCVVTAAIMHYYNMKYIMNL